MFFIVGITTGTHDLGRRKCGFFSCCSTTGAMAAVICTFQQFTFFFIPLFRFSKRYFVTCPNCGAVYELSVDEGKRIEKEYTAEIDPGKMYLVQGAYRRTCPHCNSPVDQSCKYCPNCGASLR